MRYYWYSIILFSFPSYPEFHRIVPLLQTWSTSEFVYDHASFVYMFMFGCSFHIWERICIFKKPLYSVLRKPPNCILINTDFQNKILFYWNCVQRKNANFLIPLMEQSSPWLMYKLQSSVFWGLLQPNFNADWINCFPDAGSSLSHNEM
jgi:hypothetical protein